MAAIAAAIAPAAAAVEVDPFDAIVDPEIFDKARVCTKTKRRYLKRRTKFKTWCAAKYPDWYDTVSGEVDLVALAGTNGGDSLAFKQYVMTNKGTKGRAYARHSTLSKERSMLFDYVCDAKKAGDMRPAFWIELKQWYIGIKNKENQEKAAGTLSCKEGKDELPEKMYRKFAELWLSEKPFKPGVFAFLYGSLSWMLMARTTNVGKLAYSHISVEGDCLGFRFMITKTDPNGEKYTGKKHVYANAVDPSGCSILAMAVYWMLNPHNEGNFVFTGSNSSGNFSKLLKKMCKSDEASELCTLLGRASGDIGTHSYRPSINRRTNTLSPAFAIAHC